MTGVRALRRTAGGALLLAGALAAGVSGLGCAEPPRARPVARRTVSPQWQDVFDETPELYAVVRPQAMKRDAVFGNFAKTLSRMADAQSGIGQSMLAVMESCDEVVLGLQRGAGDADASSTVLVLRGVPASVDPAKVADGPGRPLLRLVDERASVAEYAEASGSRRSPASVFVLPGRVWVITMGPASTRAREAFAHPFGRPVPRIDPAALIAIRVDERVLRTRSLENNKVVGPLVRKLVSATLALEAGKGGMTLSFQYEDDDASAWAEAQTRSLIQRLGEVAAAPPADARPRPAWLGLTKDATVERTESRVRVHMNLPPRLLDELPNVSAADLSL